ncbi:MAG: hypothetical protein WCE61_18245, partial [Candidatus Acidiferrum sp.]
LYSVKPTQRVHVGSECQLALDRGRAEWVDRRKNTKGTSPENQSLAPEKTRHQNGGATGTSLIIYPRDAMRA